MGQIRVVDGAKKEPGSYDKETQQQQQQHFLSQVVYGSAGRASLSLKGAAYRVLYPTNNRPMEY